MHFVRGKPELCWCYVVMFVVPLMRHRLFSACDLWVIIEKHWIVQCKMRPEVAGHPGIVGIVHLTVLGLF